MNLNIPMKTFISIREKEYYSVLRNTKQVMLSGTWYPCDLNVSVFYGFIYEN